eukprot:m.16804 g.16804  ORF g.16804 m.16804 type:complete len:837 (+) comp5803_c0_seq1:169-2679(+)
MAETDDSYAGALPSDQDRLVADEEHDTFDEEFKPNQFHAKPKQRASGSNPKRQSTSISNILFSSLDRRGFRGTQHEHLDRAIDAGIYLLEGELYTKFRWHPGSRASQNLYLFIHSPVYKRVEVVMALIFLSLVIFERPQTIECSLYLPMAFEVICMLYFLLNLWAQGRVLRSSMSEGEESILTVFKSRTFAVRFLVIFILFVDLILSVTVLRLHSRVLRFFRVILILDAQNAAGVRRVCRQIVQTAWKVFDMLVFVMLYIMLFAVMAFNFFSLNHSDPYFATFETSFMSMFILMTTANNPDVMMTAYNDHAGACLFFIIYMLFGFYFLMNLLLAMVYDNFTLYEKTKFKKVFMHKRQAIRHAWDALFPGEYDNEQKTINFESFHAVCRVFRPNSSGKQAYLAFRALDTDNSGEIDLNEFQEIFDVMDVKYQYNVVLTRGQSVIKPVWHQQSSNAHFRAFMKKLQVVAESKTTEAIVDFVVLINTAYIVVSAALADPRAYGPSALEQNVAAEWAFAAFYIFEATFKILAIGPRDYFGSGWNVFDFVIILFSTVGTIYQSVHENHVTLQVTIGIRSLRLLRLIRIRKSFRDTISGMGHLLPKMARFLAALSIVFYVFAIFGMFLFANTVTEKCTCDTSILNASVLEDGTCANNICGASYNLCTDRINIGPSGTRYPCTGFYQLNNFNNILRSYVTLYELMIVNNWYVIMNGHVAATGPWARAFFIVFFLVAVCIVTNITVAFILESFTKVFPLLKENKVRAAEGEVAWSRTYRTKVAIGVEEARKMFDQKKDIEMHENVEKLVYSASEKVHSSDINRILFEDDMKSWIIEEEMQGHTV